MSMVSMDLSNLDMSRSEYQKIEKLWSGKHPEKSDILGGSYVVPPVSLNCRQQKKDREEREMAERVLAGHDKYEAPNEKYDKDGKVILPKKGNYFQEQAMKKDYGFNEEKEQKLKRHHENNKRTFADKKDVVERVKIIKEKGKSPLYKEDKPNYISKLQKNEKKKTENYPRMETEIKKIKDKIKEDSKRNVKTVSEMIKKKYHKFGSLG